MTQKEQLEQAQVRVTELEGQLAEANTTISTLQADSAAAATTHAETLQLLADANLKIEGFVTQISTVEGEKSQIANQLTEATAEVTKLKSEAKTADERAREIAARSGGNLPEKQPEAGNKINPASATAGLTGMAKARAYFAARQPKPATA